MSGNFARPGNKAALNAALAVGAGIALPGKPVGTLNGALTADVAATSLVTNALTKLVPVNSVLLVCKAGDATQVDLFWSTAGAAAAATSIAVVSQRPRVAHQATDLIYLIAYQPYLALITAATAPTNNSLGSEAAYTGYARQPIAWIIPSDADPPVTSNSTLMTFGPFTAGTFTQVLTYCSQMQAISGGTALDQDAWWTLTSTRTPASGDSVQVAIGALTMQNS